jgi:hypothetical protein
MRGCGQRSSLEGLLSVTMLPDREVRWVTPQLQEAPYGVPALELSLYMKLIQKSSKRSVVRIITYRRCHELADLL